MLHVSERSVRGAKKVPTSGMASLVRRVDSGKITVSAAKVSQLLTTVSRFVRASGGGGDIILAKPIVRG